VISASTVHTHTIHIDDKCQVSTRAGLPMFAMQRGLAVVRAGFEAFARGDGAAFAAMFHAASTWHHRNDDRLGGVHRGREDILAFLGESAQLTARTLRAVLETFMTDGEGCVAVLTRVSGTRPDGRSFDVPQTCCSGSRRGTCERSTSAWAIRPR